jgi:hypothetical protein
MTQKLKGIAMSGAIGAGKTTTCEKIIAYAPDRIAKASFAGPLKTLAVTALGRPLDKATDRKFLQNLGMGMRSDEIRKTGFQALCAFLEEGHPDFIANGPLRPEQHGLLVRSLWAYCEVNEWGYTDHWADQMAKHFNSLAEQGVEFVVIEDMRFVNEYAVIKGAGLVSLRVHCDDAVRIARLTARDGTYNAKMEEDISEKQWPLIPVDILLDTTNEEAVDEEVARIVQAVLG